MYGTASDGCTSHAIGCFDSLEKLERRSIAAEEHVLAVVNELAGFAIAKRGRASAELRPRVDDEHALVPRSARTAAALSPANPPPTTTTGSDAGGAIGGPALADDCRVHLTPSIVRAQVTAAMTARRGRGMRTTREKTS